MSRADDTQLDFDGDDLVALARHRAQATPTRRAYTFLTDGEQAEKHVTYSGLDRRARAIAAELLRCGVGSGRVLLLFPPGLEYIEAFFGCLYAGVVAVPAYPPDPSRLQRSLPRLQAIAADSGACAVLTTTAIAAMAPALAGLAPDLVAMDWIAVDDVEDVVAQRWSAPTLKPEQLAFIQYTSGSTGTPKGVMLSHANVLHNQQLIALSFGADANTICFGWLPLYHDMGLIGNVIQPLYRGCTAVLMSPIDFLRRPYRWLSGVTRYRATVTGGPNFAYELCLRKITPDERETLDLSSLAVVFNGAEPIRSDTLARFADVFAACGFRREAFLPCYGLAEATLLVTAAERNTGGRRLWVDGAALADSRVVVRDSAAGNVRSLVSSGKVVGDQRVVIVDPHSRRECPEDRVGEIFVSGRSVAQGYWNRPDATQETFGAHLAGVSHAAHLRTGDLGFMRGEDLFIVSRLKDVIILRGSNHYPQDIERTVESSHSLLRPGCAAAFGFDLHGEEQLGIAVEVNVPDGRSEEIFDAIRRAVWAQHELSAQTILLLKARGLPKTSSGKIQRSACRDGFQHGTLQDVVARSSVPVASQPLDDLDDAVPATPDLRKVPKHDAPSVLRDYLQARIAHALQVVPSEISVACPIVSLGVDSLAATELAHALETQLGVDLSVTMFMQEKSICDVAAYVARALESRTADDASAPIRPISRDGRMPASRVQQRIFAIDRASSARSLYNIPVSLKLRGPLDRCALDAALGDLVRRHETLRTSFALDARGASQVIHPPTSWSVATEDLGALDLNERAIAVARIAKAEALQPFDLSRGPLLRTRLLQLGSQEHVFLLTVHHIVADGWSMGNIARELCVLYNAHRAGSAPRLSQLPVQFADFVAWQQRRLVGPTFERELAYWVQQLKDAPMLELPLDRPRASQPSFHGKHAPFSLAASTSALAELGRAHEATLFMTLMAAFQALLYTYTGQRDLCVSTSSAARTRADLAGLVGLFINRLVLRAHVSDGETFRSFLMQVRDTTLAAYAHQEAPFDCIVDALGVTSHPSLSPLCQAMLVLQNTPSADIRLDGLEVELLEVETDTSKFDLAIVLTEGPSGLTGFVEYKQSLFDDATVTGLIRDLQKLVQRVVSAPDISLRDLKLVLEQDGLARPSAGASG